ncbi:MAG: 2Fe-2S iron-sulfur cluster-binding protein [Bacillota bacterium]
MRRLQLRIFRYKPGSATRYDTFHVEVPESAHLIDALEKVWAEQDNSLTFRHACHHASCGTCGLRVNGVERLACVTRVSDYPDGQVLTLDPLRNFPVVTDLVVDVAPMFRRLQEVDMRVIREAERQPAIRPGDVEVLTRFEDCIECGLCVSACPVAASDLLYAGPAALAAAERVVSEPRGADPHHALQLVNGDHGVWRCHGVLECSEVCPSQVHPGSAIMRLRRRILIRQFAQMMGGRDLR